MYDPYDNNREQDEPVSPNENGQNSPNGEYREQQGEYREQQGNPWEQQTEYTRPVNNVYTQAPQQNYGYYGQQNPYVSPNQQKQKKPRNKKGGKWVLKVVIAALIFGILASSCYFGVNMLIDWIGPKDAPSISAPENRVERGQDTQINVNPKQDIPYTSVQTANTAPTVVTDVSQVVENAMPAMVSIDVVVTQTVQDPFSGFGGFFGYSGGSYEQDVAGSGSGIIIGQNDTELLIVSNYHVIGKAKEINVKFIDDESATAYLKGGDSDADLAVAAIKLSDLKPETLDSIKIAVMGSSDDLKLGEPAIAIGNALGYGQSVTVGYISALKREVKFTDGTMTLLQTDAAINPGNSGGALLNIRGEVIGINSAKYSKTEIEGICYAIPISDAIPKINEMMNSVTVPDSEKPYLGITGQDVPESYRSYFGWPEGVYVVEIVPNSPAALAGLKEGDIIVGFDGEEVTTMTQLQELIASCEVGDQVSITAMRSKSSGKGNYTLSEVNLSAILIARGDAEN